MRLILGKLHRAGAVAVVKPAEKLWEGVSDEGNFGRLVDGVDAIFSSLWVCDFSGVEHKLFVSTILCEDYHSLEKGRRGRANRPILSVCCPEIERFSLNTPT